MDDVKATALEHRLRGKAVSGWIVQSYIDHGKSAAVFRAKRDHKTAALKIFDDELIKRYGEASQLGRIERERRLIGVKHPHIVQIFDGGFDEITQNHFIVMELLEEPNLADTLSGIPDENIAILIEQLSRAAHFLEGLCLCHRDIKPENIIVFDDFKRLKLLDLGVVRPFGNGSITDANGIQEFVGTLQYSSPEFLLREEKDSIDGWRALTFYQIGGVLHDLLMKKPLFEDYKHPYGKLVNAVQHVVPTVKSDSAPAYLIDLATKCLIKDPEKRVKLIAWSDFLVNEQENKDRSSKQNVINRIVAIKSIQEKDGEITVNISIQKRRILQDTVHFILASVASIRAGTNEIPRGQAYLDERSKNSDDEWIIYATFEAVPIHGLHNEITSIMKLKVEDVATKIVTIEGCASIGSRPEGFRPDVSRILFQGHYDGNVILQSLERFVFETIGESLEFSESQTDETIWLIVSTQDTTDG